MAHWKASRTTSNSCKATVKTTYLATRYLYADPSAKILLMMNVKVAHAACFRPPS